MCDAELSIPILARPSRKAWSSTKTASDCSRPPTINWGKSPANESYNEVNALHLTSMVRVIVPTLNASGEWPQFAPALRACVRPEHVLIVDSGSTDGTAELARADGFQVHSVSRADFNHGGTRQMAAALLPSAEFLVYMTQDAVLAGPNTLTNLLAAFDDHQVAAACGRQLPRPGAKAIEAHARSFNYPPTSEVRSLESRAQMGIRATFLSNSLAAYRRSALIGIGGFPTNVIFGEDTITAARLLLAGYKVAYIAEACAYHSHSYTPKQEFKRYFDIGVLHSRERWLLEEFGHANGEGKRFVLSELRNLWEESAWQIPSALLRTGIKLLGYRMGRIEALLTPKFKRHLSMHPGFWTNPVSRLPENAGNEAAPSGT
jgi:rhamnosyltransferase